MMRWTTTLALGALLAFVPALRAQGQLQDYERAARFLPGSVRHLVSLANVQPHWLTGDRFWYREERGGQAAFWLFDAARDTLAPAFDQAKLAAVLSRLEKTTIAPGALPFTDFQFGPDESTLTFTARDRQIECSLVAYTCTAEPAPALSPWEVESPNHQWAAFVRDSNLWLRNLSTGQRVQLTHDGQPDWAYATPLPSLRLMVEQGTEDVRQRPGVFWSPDSSKLATYRMDSRQAGRFTSLQFVPPGQLRPKAYTYVYPLPGETLATAAPLIFDVPSGREIKVQTLPIAMYFQGGPYFRWSRDNTRLDYTWRARGYKRVEYREVDPATGSQRVLIAEQADVPVDPGQNFFALVDDGAEILWASERDGWNHLYLYNGRTGALENQVTQGHWVVRGIVHVDEKARQVEFLASGREPGEDPYQTHLYRINLDGSGLTLLTPGNANHQVSVSPDGRYLVDNFSRPDLPGESVVRRATDGGVVRVLERSDVSRLLATGWRYPEPFQGKGRDGKTEIYGLIWRPSNFSPEKKYPVIEQIYAGPQGFFVPKTFARALFGSEQPMAELGFIVVMIDGEGTAGRSRAFRDVSYRNLGDGGLPDHIAVLKQMAARYPYMDLSRAGIYGTSAGGYNAAHAILAYPDLYKVAVAISGNHDHRLDKAWWTELYEGYPVGKNYAEQSNVTLAPRLEGHLLLVHGDVDDNVHPAETMRLVDALIKANRDFDMLLVPNRFHGEGGNPYLIRRRWDYFVRYLLDVTPPHDFAIPPA